MLQAIIFDVDGTLLQSIERQEAWLQHWAEQNGKPWPLESFAQFREFFNQQIRKGGIQNVYDALGLPCDMNDRSHPVWPAFENFCHNNPTQLYPQVEEAVKEIWKMGCLQGPDPLHCRRLRLGLNSNNSRKNVLNDLGSIVSYFDTIITSDLLHGYHGNKGGDALTKPARVSLALALDSLQSSGKAAIHVGDTLDDLAASQNVLRQMPSPQYETLITVGACYGYQGRERLEKGVEISSGRAHFDYLIDEPGELIAIVEEQLKQ